MVRGFDGVFFFLLSFARLVAFPGRAKTTAVSPRRYVSALQVLAALSAPVGGGSESTVVMSTLDEWRGGEFYCLSSRGDDTILQWCSDDSNQHESRLR